MAAMIIRGHGPLLHRVHNTVSVIVISNAWH
jgi:hypothetical protein